MRIRIFLALLAMVLAATTQAQLTHAQTANAQTVVQTPQVRAEMTAEHTAVAPGESVWVAMSLDIKPGWHTYWRTPGDSGLPTTIRWTLPDGVSAGDIQWPAPDRIRYGDLMNFGYHNHVTLLTEVTLTGAATGDVMFKADATWLVCADVCIPEDGHFELPLKIVADAPRRNSAAGAAIAAAREQLPKAAPWPVKATRAGNDVNLILGPGVDKAGAKTAAFFPYQDGLIVNAAAQNMHWDGDTLRLKIAAEKGAEKYGEAAGVLTLAGESGTAAGYTFSTPITWAAPGENLGENLGDGSVSLGLALAFALIGGLILNVMPCVLPVLMMKALSFAKHAGKDVSARRRDGLAYTAGVMLAFTALVTALLALRSAGAAIGWGFQLQSPVFVAVLVHVMLALGLSLSGVFTIGGVTDMGDSLTRKAGPSGSFFTGLLAVVVATPCTAPFMAGAIGFALTQPAVTTVLVFEALALGLALPYLVLSFSPGAVRMLPRPGAWMERFKQVLAFGMYGTAAWLLWVLAQQLNSSGLAAALAATFSVAFAVWLWGVAQSGRGNGRAWAMGFAGLAFVAAVFLTATLADRPAAAKSAAETGAGSEPYSEAKLAALRLQGRPVFVNFTAAWCLTCIINERAALSTAEVTAALKAGNVAYLKADWTNRDAAISGALRALGRDGVPLYVFYGAGNAAPKILPQILTPAIVLEAVAGG